MFSILTSKIFAGTSAALLLATVLCWVGWTAAAHQRDDYHSSLEKLRSEAGTVVVAIKQATCEDGPKGTLVNCNDSLTWDTAPGQIVALGQGNRDLKRSIKNQNDTIDEMAKQAVALKAKAAELQKIADKAQAQREAALKRLSDMAITPGTRSDCMILLREAEEALDTVREAGL